MGGALGIILLLCHSVYVEQSKLSLIDLGSCTRERTKNNTEGCLLDLGNVIMAKLNGHKHVTNKYVNKIFYLHTKIKCILWKNHDMNRQNIVIFFFK